MTPSGIEPATFRFVAQYLNHCATACHKRSGSYIFDLVRKSKDPSPVWFLVTDYRMYDKQVFFQSHQFLWPARYSVIIITLWRLNKAQTDTHTQKIGWYNSILGDRSWQSWMAKLTVNYGHKESTALNVHWAVTGMSARLADTLSRKFLIVGHNIYWSSLISDQHMTANIKMYFEL
jgi:hypothetical protein